MAAPPAGKTAGSNVIVLPPSAPATAIAARSVSFPLPTGTLSAVVLTTRLGAARTVWDSKAPMSTVPWKISGQPALVGVHAGRQEPVESGIECGTAIEQCHRLRRSTVVLKWSQERINADVIVVNTLKQAARASRADQIDCGVGVDLAAVLQDDVAVFGECAGSRAIPRDDRVAQSHQAFADAQDPPAWIA